MKSELETLQNSALGIVFAREVPFEVVEVILEICGVPVAHDYRTFLFDRISGLSRTAMAAIANRARRPASVVVYSLGDRVYLAGGDWHEVTKNGWQRVKEDRS